MNYYGDGKQTPVGVPPPQGYAYPGATAGYPPQGYPGYPPQQQMYQQPPPQYQQQQQENKDTTQSSCLAGCLAALCCCCLCDLLF